MVTHPTRRDVNSRSEYLGILVMAADTDLSERRLGRHLLPAVRTLLDVRVIPIRVPTVIPVITLGLRHGLSRVALDIRRRRRRHCDHGGRVGVVGITGIVRIIGIVRIVRPAEARAEIESDGWSPIEPPMAMEMPTVVTASAMPAMSPGDLRCR
jgi:hypothetical protein